MSTLTATAPATTTVPTARSITRHIPTAIRILFGLAFVVFGLDGFLQFIPRPTTPPPQAAGEFAYALIKTGYMFPLIKGTEVLVGLLLVTNVFVPLALVLIAPVLVNIIAFHAFLMPDGLGIALIFVAVELYLAWRYRHSYRALFVIGTR